jgi:hypothetical protein
MYNDMSFGDARPSPSVSILSGFDSGQKVASMVEMINAINPAPIRTEKYTQKRNRKDVDKNTSK